MAVVKLKVPHNTTVFKKKKKKDKGNENEVILTMGRWGQAELKQ